MASTPYIREAKEDDFEDLARMLQRSFIHSPPQTFYARLDKLLTAGPEDTRKRENQLNYLRFLVHRAKHMKARMTVVAVSIDGQKEKIAAATVWEAPGVRKPPSVLVSLCMPGLIPLLFGWGFDFRKRIYQMLDATKSALTEGYAAKQLPGTPADSWYLQLAGTDPEFQGKGYMSMLIREAIANAGPDSIFTLEANNPNARDVYKKYGFEVVGEVRVGKGQVDTTGVLAQGERATGFPMYAMIRA